MGFFYKYKILTENPAENLAKPTQLDITEKKTFIPSLFIL